jgi:hypothetical protein
MSSENYRNLFRGNINQPGRRTPGFLTANPYQPYINILNFAEVASADIAEAQLQNSPFASFPAIGCTKGYLGSSACVGGLYQGKLATEPIASQFNNGTVAAFTENFASCGKGAEGKLHEVYYQPLDQNLKKKPSL